MPVDHIAAHHPRDVVEHATWYHPGLDYEAPRKPEVNYLLRELFGALVG
jgi:hypothetical protein